MNHINQFVVPPLIAQRFTISAELRTLWAKSVFTVKQAKTKFFNAYKKTVDELTPGWKDTWRNDPAFNNTLMEIEDLMWELCRGNGMEKWTFSRFKNASRKALLTGIPFHLSSEAISVEEAKIIGQSSDPVATAKEIHKLKKASHARNALTKTATVLPLPEKTDDPKEYFEDFQVRLQEHINLMAERLGQDVVDKLLQSLSGQDG